MNRRRVNALAAVSVALLGLVAALVAAAFAVPLPARLFSAPSAVVRYHDGTPMHVFLSPDEKWRIPPSAHSAVDARYVEALVRLEDKRFFYHPGFDPVALARAFAKNLYRRRVVSGGSTLTMQLVRVLEPRPRTLSAKLVELCRAAQLTVRLSKREVLDAYMTFIPFGRNVEGVEAAAFAYFGHGAAGLGAAEIATLLAVPQDPNRRFPTPANVVRLQNGRDRIARQLAGWRTARFAAELADVRRSLVPGHLRAFPRAAPHAAFHLRAQDPADLDSTLDPGIQALAERLVHAAKRQAQGQGVKNVAVVVVEQATGAVRALVGGFDFFEADSGSQIPGFRIPRSPGSALKPFIYALAIDQGLALPEHLVEDVPRLFSGYSPKNYDGRYSGLVTLELALAQSLNVPFVNLLERLGLERFLGTLTAAGVGRVGDTPGKLGLSAAIGGIELTALELAGLFAALAEDGEYRPLSLTRRQLAATSPHTLSLFKPGAAWLTRRALRLRDRPDFPRRKDFTRLAPNVFWKTGTSFGHKDAWALGAGSRYTAAVWFGNADNKSSFALVGAEIAAPLLFDVLEGLESPGGRLSSDARPEDLKEIQVCAYSGHVPGPGCAHTKRVLALASDVPTAACPYHVALDVDAQTGLALTPMCRESRDFTTRRFMVWPAAVKRFLGDAHRELPEPPAVHPACRAAGTGRTAQARLTITSPKIGHTVVLIPGLAATRQEVPLEAETDSLAGTLNWFVNGAFVGRFPRSERVWWTPEVGDHEITVADGLGLVASRKLTVVNHP